MIPAIIMDKAIFVKVLSFFIHFFKYLYIKNAKQSPRTRTIITNELSLSKESLSVSVCKKGFVQDIIYQL